MTGTNAAMYVPATTHDLWGATNTVPKLLQSAPDSDLNAVVKFESVPRYKVQIQGLVAQQDSRNLIRFSTSHDGKSVRIFAAVFVDGSSTTKVNKAISLAAPVHLRMKRVGDGWTLSYSGDGTSWTVAAAFDHALTLTEVGPFVGNAFGSPFVSSVDYFEISGDPITDEDGGQPPATTPGPVVDLWYGDEQSVGHVGTAQQWFNVIGGVADPDGVGALRYTVNGGTSAVLNLGPDGFRLVDAGDFNAELDIGSLVEGVNEVELEAMDIRGDYATYRMKVHRTVGVSPALPHTVDWSSAASIQDIGHIVDGRWSLANGEVRTAQRGYDRLIGVGSQAWGAYEVTVQIVIHHVDGAVGVLTGWTGHTGAKQPRTGHPYGALGWYAAGGKLELRDRNVKLIDSRSRVLTLGERYLFKMRMEPLGDGNSRYSLRVWPDGQPEPTGWDVSGTLPARAGSTLLVAHHADASFGHVSFTPLS